MPGTIPEVDPKVAATANQLDMAIALLRSHNMHEFRSTVSFPGTANWPGTNIAITSGVVINIVGKGLFDGRWIVEIVKHTVIESKLETEVQVRKCIDTDTYKKLSSQIPLPNPATAGGPVASTTGQ